MSRKARHYALVLLVIFALGGLVSPLVHDGVHAMEAHDKDGPHSEEVLVEHHSEVFECDLCEITLFAADLLAPPSNVLGQVEIVAISLSSIAPDDAPQGLSRAPPAGNLL